MAGKLRKCKGPVLALTFGFLLAVLAAEIFFRAAGIGFPVLVQADDLLGVSLRPGAAGWYSMEGRAYVKINAQGMRDDCEIPLEKRDGTFRIAVLGDSYMEARQVPWESSFCRVLERIVNQSGRGKKIEVLNFACSGYGTAQEYLQLQYRVFAFAPDLILLGFLTGNDISDNSPALKQAFYVPYFTLRKGQLFFDSSYATSDAFQKRKGVGVHLFTVFSDYSRVLQMLNYGRYVMAVSSQKSAMDSLNPQLTAVRSIYSPPDSPEWTVAWQITERLILEMANESRRHAVPFRVVVLSNGIQVHPDPAVRSAYRIANKIDDLYYPDKRVASLCGKNKIPALALSEIMTAEAEKKKLFFHGFGKDRGDGHWNEAGHRFAAEQVAAWLLREDAL